MKKITTLMVLLMSLALSACAKNTTNEGKPNTDPETNQPGGNTDTGEGNTNPDQGGDTEGGETEGGDQPGGNTNPDQGGGSTDPDEGGNTNPDQGGGTEGGETEGGTTDDVPAQNPHRPTLPCGQTPIDRPENAANPIKLSTTRPADEFKLPKPDNYTFIYGNNPNTSADPFTEENNQGGGYSIKYQAGKPIHGVQTPIWEAWHEDWIKVEVRFTINYWQGNAKKETPTADPYLFYCFDIQGNLIKEISKPVPTKILDEDNYINNQKDPYIEIDLENNEENRKIRYVEMRVVDYVNSQAGKSVSTVFSNCRIREYHSTKNQ